MAKAVGHLVIDLEHVKSAQLLYSRIHGEKFMQARSTVGV